MWSDAFAQSTSGAAGGSSPLSLLVQFGYIPLLFLIMYLLMIRPQQQRQKALQKQLAAIKKGDRVLTTGGILGEVVGTRDEVVILRIAENVKVEFAKSAVVQVMTEPAQ